MMASGILAYEELEYHYSIQHIESIKQRMKEEMLRLDYLRTTVQ